MKDLHTHILPGMDDGAPDVKTAIMLLEAEAKQGIDTVALTPHFYRNREHISDFLERRQMAADKLRGALEGKEHPRLILAAEVAYAPGMADWHELDALCYEGTRLLLVEPPMAPWNDEMLRQLYAIEGRRGITPMIAHIDRYLATQKRAHIEQLLESGFPLQVSTAALLQPWIRRKALRLLTDYNAALISDCHNPAFRPPNWESAVRVLEKRLGGLAAQVLRNAENYIG